MMKMLSRLIARIPIILPLFAITAPEANAGPAARGTLEVKNRTDKSVTCRLVSYLKERSKGEYPRRGARAGINAAPAAAKLTTAV